MSAVLKEQPRPLTEAELIAIIDDAESRSYGSSDSNLTAELSAQRGLSIDLYLGNDVDPAPEGQSSVIDRSVFETVQWILPSLCRIFASGDDVVVLSPINEDDVDQAKQETTYLNWLVTNKHPWFELFLEWATDALLTKNAYFLVYRDNKRSVDIEKYEGQTKEGLALLLQEKGVQLIQSRSYVATDLPAEPMIGDDGQPIMQMVSDPATGQMVAQPVMGVAELYDVVIRRVSDTKNLCIRVLPPERVKVDQQTYSWRVNESCGYFEFWEDVTISSLREQGFEVDDDIADDRQVDTQEDQARNTLGESQLNISSAIDKSMRRVRARMIWIRTDADRDGMAELLKVLRIGRTVVYKEEVSSIPVASGVACPLPHRHVGLSVADQVADIQRIKTAILRQGLDNLYLSNNPQKVVNESLTNIDDALVSRPGGLIRSTDIVNGIRHEQVPFVFSQAVEGLEYMGKVAQNRTGVNNGFAGIDSSSLNDIQPGTVNQLSGMAAERVIQIARVLAFGIEDLFAIIHEQVLKMGHKKESLQIGGKWVEVDPGAWRKRTDFKIAVAFAAGNKDAQVQRLAFQGQKQFEALVNGIPVCTPENYFETLTELSRATDMTATGRFWTHPQKMPAKPPPPPPEGIITTQMDNQSAERIKAAELAQKERDSIRDAQLKKYQIDSEHGLELISTHIAHGHDVAIEGLKASHAAILEALSAKVDGNHNATSAAVEKSHQVQTQKLANVGETLDKVLAQVKHAGKLATAKRHARRNDKGELEGVDLHDRETGELLASHTAVKDKSGRVIGMQ